MKKLALIALLPLFVSCGPYQLKYWLVTMDQAKVDPSTWPSSCFPNGGTDAATFRSNNAATFDQFRMPMRWQTWEVKDKQAFLQVDAAVPALANAIADGTKGQGTGGFQSPPAAQTNTIEGTDGKTFTATYTEKRKNDPDAAQFTYTTTLKVAFVSQDSATSGTVDVTVARACSGTGTQCTDSNYTCALTGIPFSARRIEGVQNTILVAPAPQQP